MKFYEDSVKNSILQNEIVFKNVLGDLGQSCIVYEKTISGRVISDVLICSSKLGLIGVEIKTSHDNTKRLPNQLKEYSKTCNYVFVLCHDELLSKVKQVITENKLPWVGIILYDEFDDEAVYGVYKQPKLSPKVKTRYASSIIWNSEKKLILDNLYHKNGYYKQITKLFNTIEVTKAEKLIASLYAHHYTKPEHALQRYHFGDTYVHDTTVKGEFKRAKRKKRY